MKALRSRRKSWQKNATKALQTRKEEEVQRKKINNPKVLEPLPILLERMAEVRLTALAPKETQRLGQVLLSRLDSRASLRHTLANPRLLKINAFLMELLFQFLRMLESNQVPRRMHLLRKVARALLAPLSLLMRNYFRCSTLSRPNKCLLILLVFEWNS